MFGTWKWDKKDHETPLIFPLSGANAYFYLSTFDPGTKDREITWDATFEVHITPVPAKTKKGLTTTGKHSTELAEKIYDYYLEVAAKIESLLLSTANIKNLFLESPMTLEQFYSNDGGMHGEDITWSINGSKPKKFTPKIRKDRRELSPLFKRNQLVDKNKWGKLQEAIYDDDFPQDEIIEVLKIRTKIAEKHKKIPVIEASILIETILRQYLKNALKAFGFSNTKIKTLRDELTFNSMLNLVTPLTLSKSESKAIQPQINATNALRKIRNDLVHGNISEDKVEMSNIIDGIEGALKLIALLKQKINKKA